MIVHALSSFKQIVKNGFIGIRALVKKLACARGWFSRIGNDIALFFTPENPIKHYINCNLQT